MISIGERHIAWVKQDSNIPFLTCLGKIPLLTKYKNFALAHAHAHAKYLCKSSAYISQDEKRKFLTIQTAKHPLIRLEMSLLVLIFLGIFFPFPETGGK